MKQFKTYFVAAELSEKSEAVQVARLLNAAGPEAQEVHELFEYEAEADKKKYTKILEKFTEYCRPKKNVVYERYKFWSHSQKEGELFDPWLKDLRIIAKDCEFTEEQNMIRDKIVFGVYDKKVQERMLRKSDLKLKDAIDTCRAAESSQNQMAEMRKQEASSVSEIGTKAFGTKAPPAPVADGSNSKGRCFVCNAHNHYARDCPKKVDGTREETKCYNCEGFGHMSRDCSSGDSYSSRKRKRKTRRGRGGRGGAGRYGTREVHEVDDDEMKEYMQEFSSLSLPVEERPPIRGKEDLLKMYPECFEQGVDKHFKNFEYEIKVDPQVPPKIHPPRRIPLELRDKLKDKLDEMERKGVITRVPEPTRWVNSMVVETKGNGDLRVCLDPMDLNKAVMREYHPIPAVEDIVPKLNGSDLFTKLDLKDGYWHIKLSENSSYLTTFGTPNGKYRYERLPFGLCTSQDIFQYKIDETYGAC